jgi:hypothetical protein
MPRLRVDAEVEVPEVEKKTKLNRKAVGGHSNEAHVTQLKLPNSNRA